MSVVSVAAGSSDTTINFIPPAAFPANGGVVQIESENIQYANATDTQLLGCTRGVQGTSGATHAVGKGLTLLEGPYFVPAVPTANATQAVVLALTDASAVPTAKQLDINSVISVTLDSSGSNQTWTLPALLSTAPRFLVINLVTGSTKSLTVNSVSISAGTGQMFCWDGVNWTAV